jgi:hypothetical protein
MSRSPFAVVVTCGVEYVVDATALFLAALTSTELAFAYASSDEAEPTHMLLRHENVVPASVDVAVRE